MNTFAPPGTVFRFHTAESVPDYDGIELDRLELAPGCSERRAHQFLLGRFCARGALRELGQPCAGPLSRASFGGVVWPLGVVGSISHSGGSAAAVVGLSSTYRSLGLDIESMTRVRRVKIATRICTPRELSILPLPDDPNYQKALITLFSTKESLFKLLNPITGVYFGFQDAEADVVQESSVTLRLTRDLSEDFQIGWSVTVNLKCNANLVFSICGVMQRLTG